MGTLIGIGVFLVIINLLFIIAIKKKFSFVFVLMLLSFSLKAFIVFINYYYNIIALDNDAFRYDDFANQVARYLSGSGGFPQNAFAYEPGYTVPIGVLYSIFGHHPEIPALLNALFTTLTIWNVYRISLLLFNNERGAKAVAILYAASPYITILSFYILRDALINYLMSQLFVIFISRSKEGKKIISISTLALIFMLGFLRTENMVLLTMVVIIYNIIKSYRNRQNIFWIMKFIFVIICPIVIIIATLTYGPQYRIFQHFKIMVDYNVIVDIVQKKQDSSTGLKGVYLKGADLHSPGNIAIYAPLKIVYFLFSPFPWDVGKKKSYIIFCLDAIMVLVLFMMSLGSLKSMWKNKKPFETIVILYLAIGILGGSLLSANVAGAQRHRTQFTFLIYACVSRKLFQRKQVSKQRIKLISTETPGKLLEVTSKYPG